MSNTSSAVPQRFSDRGVIARGGGGAVRRAFDCETQREVAIKILDGTADAAARAHFLAEARVMARLDHPGIVALHDIGRDERGEPSYLLMKLVEGRTLEDAIASTSFGPATAHVLEPLLQALLRVCEAVSFAHGRGVIHRDLKPGNVMLGSHGQVYTMDWGMALLRDRPADAAPSTGSPPARVDMPAVPDLHDVCGTPAYMAPEQARGAVAEIDERSDVFGLGAILYEILTLQPPHRGRDLATTLEAARRCRIAPADLAAPPGRNVPARLAAICSTALSPEPDARHRSVDAFAQDVEDFVRGGGWFPIERFPAGAVMLREGEPGDRAFIIAEGCCEVFRKIGHATRVLRRIGAGQAVGEVALLAPGPRIASVRACTDVSVMVVTRASLERELARAPWMGSLLREAAERYSEAEALRERRPRGGAASRRHR